MSMITLSSLGVVILNWNNAADTTSCVHHISQTWDQHPHIIVVVDNHSREDDLALLKSSKLPVHLIENDMNYGFGGGTNLGIAAALESGSESILLLNNDARISQESIQRLQETMTSDPRIAAVGPVLYDDRQLLSAGGRNIALHRDTHLRKAKNTDTAYDVFYTPGTVLLLRSAVLEKVGLLDEHYFFSGEVADLCHRIRKQGFRCVIDPLSSADHAMARSATMRNDLHQYYELRNRFLFVRKHYQAQIVFYYGYWTLLGASKIIAAALRRDWRRFRFCWLGLHDGLLGRFGNRNRQLIGTD